MVAALTPRKKLKMKTKNIEKIVYKADEKQNKIIC